MAHEALSTSAKLVGFGMDIEDKCSLCGLLSETMEHLFCACPYSRRIIWELNKITAWDFPSRNTMDWCVHRTGTALQRGIQNAMMMSVMYQIWQQRNKSRTEKVLIRPEVVAGLIMEEMKSRVRTRDRTLLTLEDRDWLKRFRLMV
ncbi:uncharacterized protein LOC141627865 [Silene latifolia]|uniref:uncharacterized protein LOC141627865 n=1 Tax=Silene latifolia TaxID=37657 RepID=UPI003D776F7C